MPIKLNYRKFLIALVIVLSAVASASAQGKTARAKGEPQAAQVREADSRREFRKNFIKATEEYKASLQSLLDSYEGSARKQTAEAAKLKELYAEGLIARREFEAIETAVAEAKLKVEDVRKQIASTEVVLAAALKEPESTPAAVTNTFVAASASQPWTTGSARIDGLIRLNGLRYGVDPYLIFCIMHQESRFNSSALSNKGAQGLMQLMPGTAARYGVVNSSDPAQNIMGGTRYLKDLLQLFNGRIDLVLAGYNAGEGAVMKYGQRVPPYRETQDYVRLIGARYRRNASPAPSSTTLTVQTRTRTR